MADFQKLRRHSRHAASLLWLLLLYVSLTYLAVGTISVSQINTGFGNNAGIIFHLADLADQQRRVRSEQLKNAEAAADLAGAARDHALIEVSVMARRLGIPAATVNGLADPKAPVRLRDFVADADDESCRAWDAAVSEYLHQKLAHDLSASRRDQLLDELRGGMARMVGAQSTDGKPFAGIDESVFQTATSTAAGLRAFGYAWLFPMPSEVLTLVLALVLGALGSTLHMTKVVIEGTETPAPSWYLFRPCQGVLMALVVFVLLKAGQLTMGAGDSDTLNPFFVAFVGTVSGLLSPDAYRLIQRAGATVIPASDQGDERWAFGLARTLTDSGFSAADLAGGVGVNEQELAAWVAETAPVPATHQALIAAWLHADARLLFTMDKPPLTRAPSEASAPVPA
ncbi:MAG TPA: hypothetical protein VK196_01805 [Magnetospirillum sp.]|nr:hypothetical protein [Magnetospirillum sp.]